MSRGAHHATLQAGPSSVSDERGAASISDALSTEKDIVVYPDAPHAFLRFGAAEHKASIDDALARTFRFLSRLLSG